MPLGKKILEYEKLNLVATSFRFYKGKIKGHEKLQISTAQQKCCLEKKKVAKAVDQRSRLSEKKETKQNKAKKRALAMQIDGVSQCAYQRLWSYPSPSKAVGQLAELFTALGKLEAPLGFGFTAAFAPK